MIRDLLVVVKRESETDLILFKELENVEYPLPVQMSSELDGAQHHLEVLDLGYSAFKHYFLLSQKS